MSLILMIAENIYLFESFCSRGCVRLFDVDSATSYFTLAIVNIKKKPIIFVYFNLFSSDCVFVLS